MKKYIIILGLALIGFASCKKSTSNVNVQFNAAAQAKIDDSLINDYITKNNLDSVKKDPSGLYYKIITPGEGNYPTINSRITATYKGTLLNGTVFAPQDVATEFLGAFIGGWQVGIPYINSGGTILLLIPSALGYGNTPRTGIPVNSILVFTVTLTSFQ